MTYFRIILYYTVAGLMAWGCRSSTPAGANTARNQIATPVLVMPGDYPDPSVTKIGNIYWATATSSNWFPAYPLLKSTDLVNWQTTGFVFSKKPDWADYYFWAPELTYDNGRVYVYYTAHKKGGNLCVAVASADKPEGPYRDHGPLVCEADGSIDAFPMRDETGKLYLIWKEDGNSVGKPTPIWAQPMNEERTALTDEKRELFRNDAPWEANLVEGVSIIKHQNYYYAFYAAAGCCGPGCTYATGIARAKNLLGPWEKYSKNPIMTADAIWKCPGHGTPVERNGRNYFLYHAYNKEEDVHVGRQTLLREFRFTDDDWLAFEGTAQPVSTAQPTVQEEFNDNTLSTAWNWSVFHQPTVSVQNGLLRLMAQPDKIGEYIAHRTTAGNYTAQTTIRRQISTAEAGLALIGDDDNAVGISLANGQTTVWKREKGVDQKLATANVVTGETITLRSTVKNGKTISFAYSVDGKPFVSVDTSPIDGSFLPPWDRAVRVGLTAKGNREQAALFDAFTITSE
ncbi:family 43 glycosylhydrolase [Spirosoma fluminis]